MNNPSTLRAGDLGADVTVLQQRLARAGIVITPNGHYDDATVMAVRTYQQAHGLIGDGIAGPRTQSALAGVIDPRALTQADLARAASDLGCEVAAIQAVIEVESPRTGFLADGRVVILFERHVFWQQLTAAGVDPATLHAPTSILSQVRGGYVGGVGEYPRLAAAKAYGAEQAVASCSWGRFQIMGYHAHDLGYDSAIHLAEAFATGEAEQIRAFVRFVQADTHLHDALHDRDWPAFAKRYNGPDYAANLYDTKLSRAYVIHAGTSGVTA